MSWSTTLTTGRSAPGMDSLAVRIAIGTLAVDDCVAAEPAA
ncbi:MAG: hypothetical protein ACK4IT_05565 [Thioalkalivibrionaceae bacterium]